MNNVLQCQTLTKTYQQGDEETCVLNALDLTINEGELVAIVGRSGCGKSTFLHLAGGLDEPSEGKVVIKGVDIHQLSDKKRAKFRNENIGFIYQFHHLMMEFSAQENVAMPLLIRGEKPKDALNKARDMLNKVGLSHRLTHLPSQLSGGERQRVAIARALVPEPALVLADEPTGNLDSDTAEQVYQLLIRLNKELNTSFVIVTHDLSLANKMQKQLTFEQGKLVNLTPDAINTDPTETIVND